MWMLISHLASPELLVALFMRGSLAMQIIQVNQKATLALI
jgi:hypothetical protein